jgi:hypothetical protein
MAREKRQVPAADTAHATPSMKPRYKHSLLKAVGLNKSKVNESHSIREAIIYDDFFDCLLSTYCTEGLIGLSGR